MDLDALELKMPVSYKESQKHRTLDDYPSNEKNHFSERKCPNCKSINWETKHNHKNWKAIERFCLDCDFVEKIK
jgi:hypothetical protein|tara:strand:+ start:5388 stop:5609 length:222 start_codon:yes stop_codon:yes gene_type:complete